MEEDRTEYTYTEDGQIKTETKFEADTTEGVLVEKTRTEYIYTKDGHLKTETMFRNGSTEGTIISEYIFDASGNPLEYYKNGELGRRYTYDEYGNCISTVNYSSDGSVSGRGEFLYVNGKLAKEYVEYFSYKTIELDNDTTIEVPYLCFYYYEYDEQGRETKLVEYVDEEAPRCYLYTYLDRQYTIEEQTVLGEAADLYICENDDIGRKTKETYDSGVCVHEYESNKEICYYYAEDGTTLEGIDLFEYNDDGEIIYEGYYDNEWVLVRDIKKKYDKYGNLTEEITTEEDGTIDVRYGPTREYDENGNLVKEIYCNDINYVYSF